MSFQPPPYQGYPFSGPTGYPYWPQPAASPPPPGPMPLPPGMTVEGAKRQVQGAIQARYSTDAVISPMWVVAVLVLYIAAAVTTTALMLSIVFSSDVYGPFLSFEEFWERVGRTYVLALAIAAVAAVVQYGIIGMLAYKLVRRQNEHFTREAQLRTGLISLLRAGAGSPEREMMISGELASATWINSSSIVGDRTRSPLVWCLVALLPGILAAAMLGVMALAIWSFSEGSIEDLIMTWGVMFSFISFMAFFLLILIILRIYLLYALSNEMYEHDRRWHPFLQSVMSGLYRLGHRVRMPFWTQPIPERALILYIVLWILTSGLVEFYWWYVLIKDPNDHFKRQWTAEDELKGALGL